VSSATTFRQSLSLLKTRRYGTYWFASLLGSLGTWVQQVAQPWLMLSITNSSFMLGLDSFAMDAPIWLLTVLGGQLADRSDRRKVIFWCQSIQGLTPLLLMVLVLTKHVSPWAIIACSLVIGVTDALSMPSYSSIVPSIVERHQVGAGIALKSMQFNLSRILGPAIAGVLLTSVGAAACFGISAASYVPFVLSAWLVLPAFVATKTPASQEKTLGGIRVILEQPRLRGALMTALTTGLLCSPLITFCPVLIRDGFKAGPESFSAALSGFGLGGILGGATLLAIENRFDRRVVSSTAGLAFAAVVLLCGLTPWLWSVPILMTLGGIAMSFSNTQANSYLQLESGGRRGQAASLFMLAMRGGLSIGALITGTVASNFNIHWALIVNGSLALVLHFFVGRFWRNAT
jgi:MFS family permease